MRFTTHSPNDLFSKKLHAYAKSKLVKPILRHKINDEAVTIRCDAEKDSSIVNLRVSVLIPGEDRHTITSSQEELNAAIDIAADKMERLFRDLSDRKKSQRRQSNVPDYTEELGEDDYLTDGEEDVLRELGALDVVLEP